MQRMPSRRIEVCVPYRTMARWTAMAVVLVSCIGCDQVTKQLAVSQLKGHPRKRIGAARCGWSMPRIPAVGTCGQLPPAARWLAMVVGNGIVTAVIFALLRRTAASFALGVRGGAVLLAGARQTDRSGALRRVGHRFHEPGRGAAAHRHLQRRRRGDYRRRRLPGRDLFCGGWAGCPWVVGSRREP